MASCLLTGPNALALRCLCGCSSAQSLRACFAQSWWIPVGALSTGRRLMEPGALDSAD